MGKAQELARVVAEVKKAEKHTDKLYTAIMNKALDGAGMGMSRISGEARLDPVEHSNSKAVRNVIERRLIMDGFSKIEMELTEQFGTSPATLRFYFEIPPLSVDDLEDGTFKQGDLDYNFGY
jgi:alkaline phosphatase